MTLTDILEAIVGDVAPSSAEDEARAVQREDGSWLPDGMLPADELRDPLGVDSLPGEDAGQYQTLGGFVRTFMSTP